MRNVQCSVQHIVQYMVQESVHNSVYLILEEPGRAVFLKEWDRHFDVFVY